MQIFLRSASLLECKTFLASFVRRLEFDGQQVRIEYTIPVTLGDESTARSEAPNVGRIGSPSRRHVIVFLRLSMSHIVQPLR